MYSFFFSSRRRHTRSKRDWSSDVCSSDLGPAAGIGLLIPITFGMDPTSALIMMAGIYYGAMYGGSTTSILINTPGEDRKSTRLNSSHVSISYAVFCLKKKKKKTNYYTTIH